MASSSNNLNRQIAELDKLIAEFNTASPSSPQAVAPPLPPIRTTAPGILGRGSPSRNLTRRSNRVKYLATTPSGSSSPSSTLSNASSVSISNVEPNVSSVSINPKNLYPDAVNRITDLKRQIAVASKEIEGVRPKLQGAIASVKQIGSLNVGDKSFRGKNGPQVYVANDPNNDNYIVRANFMVNGRPFRVQNDNSFNSVLSHMKEKRSAAGLAMKGLRETQTQFKALESKLAGLDRDLKSSTEKLRRNMANATAKRAQTLRKEARSRPTQRVSASNNVRMANQLLQSSAPQQKGFFQRLLGRGGKRRNANATRRRR